jgi:hypothetical protein
MSRTLFIILGALGISVTTLSGCGSDSYDYYMERPDGVYSERVVLGRSEYYAVPKYDYRHRKMPPPISSGLASRRNPHCFETNCYIGTTYREDSYYR